MVKEKLLDISINNKIFKVREDIINFFKDRNYKLIIENDILNLTYKVKYTCCCGNEYYRKIKDIKKTLMCKFCKIKKENNIQQIEKIIDNVRWIRIEGGWISETGKVKNLYDTEMKINSRRVYINKEKKNISTLMVKYFKISNYEKLENDKSYKIIHIDGNIDNNHINNLVVTNKQTLEDEQVVRVPFYEENKNEEDIIEINCENKKINNTYNFDFLFKYINSTNYLNIPKEISTELYKNLNNEIYKNDLLNWCVENIKIPDNIIDYDKHLIDLNNFNKSINTEIIDSKIIANNNGSTFLNYYVLKNLLYSSNKNCNFINYWNNPELKKSIINRTLTNLQPKSIIFNSFIQSYGYMYKKVNNFPANVARCIYNKYGGQNVLDFCSGFGGRLLGFWGSTCKNYIGIDPNKNINYKDILNVLQEKCTKNKSVKIYRKCAEDLDFKTFNLQFDCVFTSPPYFNLEVYTSDTTQCYNRYPQYDEWLNKFFYTCLNKSIEVLKIDGYLIINIKNIKKYNIADDMNNYLQQINNIKRLSDIEMVQSRKFLKKNKELLFIYQKIF